MASIRFKTLSTQLNVRLLLTTFALLMSARSAVKLMDGWSMAHVANFPLSTDSTLLTLNRKNNHIAWATWVCWYCMEMHPCTECTKLPHREWWLWCCYMWDNCYAVYTQCHPECWYSIRTPQANGRLTTLIRVEGDKSTEQQDQEEREKRLYCLDSTAWPV